MSRWAGLVVTLGLVWAPEVAAESSKWQEHRVAGIVFSAPASAEVTTESVDTDVTVVAVTHRKEVLLITLYRGKSAPSAKRALAAHGEEFERRVSKDGRMRMGRGSLRVLGRKRTYRTIDHGAEDARQRMSLFAIKLTKTTLVAAWTAPSNRGRPIAPKLLQGLSME